MDYRITMRDLVCRVVTLALVTLALLAPVAHAQSGVHRYVITVFTGNADGAGTDADVSIYLYGTAGTSGFLSLNNTARNDFERNSVCDFEFYLPDLGALYTIYIGHNNSGNRPGWYLDKVVVQDMTAGRSWVFAYHVTQGPCWLSTDRRDYPYDGRTWRYLPY